MISLMGAFLANPVFLFVDDPEPRLPSFRSTKYGNTSRIVEVTDVGCDTDTTIPMMHSPRGAYDRRRGGAESLGSTRRITKWLNERPNAFARRARDVNNNEDRNGNYIQGKRNHMQQDVSDYDDDPDLDSNDSFTENDDLGLPKNDLAIEEDSNYYAQFINPQNMRLRRERISHNYLRDLESPFRQGIRINLCKVENASPWLVESDEPNVREIHDTDVQPGKRKKRTKVLSRKNGSFNREAEYDKTHEIAMHRERNDLPNAAAPVVPPRNAFWDFVSFNNDTEREGPTFYKPMRIKNHVGLQKMAPRNDGSYIFDSQPKDEDTVDTEGEKEFKETLKQDNPKNLPRKTPINRARYRSSKSNAIKETPKILWLSGSNTMTPSQNQLTRMSVGEQTSNIHLAERDSINVKPYSTTKRKMDKSATTERREEITIATQTTVDDHQLRYHDKFINKLSNNSPKRTSQSTRLSNRVADSTSSGRSSTANDRDNANSHHGNNKMDRNNVTDSRLAPEETVTKNDKTFAMETKMDAATDVEKEIEKKKRKFFSRLPVKTWKHPKTKEPAASRPESDVTNGDLNRELRKVKNETAKSNDHPKRIETVTSNNRLEKVGNVRGREPVPANRYDVQRSERFRNRLLGVHKPGFASANSKSVKGVKDLSTTRKIGATEEESEYGNVRSQDETRNITYTFNRPLY